MGFACWAAQFVHVLNEVGGMRQKDCNQQKCSDFQQRAYTVTALRHIMCFIFQFNAFVLLCFLHEFIPLGYFRKHRHIYLVNLMQYSKFFQLFNILVLPCEATAFIIKTLLNRKQIISATP